MARTATIVQQAPGPAGRPRPRVSGRIARWPDNGACPALHHDPSPHFMPLDNPRLAHLCGPPDAHLRTIEAALNVRITRRDAAFRVDGAKAPRRAGAGRAGRLYEQASRPLDAQAVNLALAGGSRTARCKGDDGESPVLHTRRADLAGRTPNQVQYLRHILSHDMTLRHRPGGHRQDLSCGGVRGRCARAQPGAAHRADAARRSRRASGSASCRATWRRRSTRTCARCTTRCTT